MQSFVLQRRENEQKIERELISMGVCAIAKLCQIIHTHFANDISVGVGSSSLSVMAWARSEREVEDERRRAASEGRVTELHVDLSVTEDGKKEGRVGGWGLKEQKQVEAENIEEEELRFSHYDDISIVYKP